MKLQFLIIFILGLPLFLFAQNKQLPPLERTVKLQAEQETIEAVLSEISRQTEISFSYNPKAMDASKHINIDFSNHTVRFALNSIFEGEAEYRERGRFVIIQPRKTPRNNPPAIVEGYLIDSAGDKLANATVYSPAAFTAVTTDEFGYFRLEVQAKDTTEAIRMSKRGFEDVLLMPAAGRSTFVELEMSVREEILKPGTINREIPDIQENRLIGNELSLAVSNISESFSRVVQFSLLPHVGTNSLLAGNTSNIISLNLLGGYVESVTLLELGAVLNIVRNDARYLQGAGVGNFVGGNFTGFQGAGVINRTAGKFTGFQGSGVLNFAGNDFKGFQAASVINTTVGNFSGFQASGVLNYAGGNFYGLQAAAVFNSANSIMGAQLSGFVNSASVNVKGLQAASVANIAKKIHGAQLAAVINLADTITGLQASAIVNRAKYVKGLQLGLINIADSCAGVPIGLISIVKNGYHKLDFYTSEIFTANMAFSTGVEKFHNILLFGVDPGTLGSRPLYTYGLGVGTSFGNSQKLSYNFDATGQQIVLDTYNSDINMIYKLGFGIDRQLSQNIALSVGLSYNLYLTDAGTEEFESILNFLPPYYISNEFVGNNRNLKSWIGFKAGVRLF